jgi:peptide/nickel transport system ATP-binding protein
LIQLYDQTSGSTLYYGNTMAEIAPKYVQKVVNNIKADFPKFKADRDKLAELKAEFEETTDATKLHALEEKIMLTSRDLENKYLNLPRIVGGLLTHSDLQEVSKLLNAEYKIQVEIAEANRKIDALETKKTNPKIALKPQSLQKVDSEIAAIEQTISTKEAELAKAQAETEVVREQCRSNEGFEEYESQRDNGIDLSKLEYEEMRRLRADVQIIFQDPYSSLDPRLTVGQIIGEGLVAHGKFKNQYSNEYNQYIQDIMEECGLAPYFIHRYPHQFSGGQRQRIGIARALALRPKFIVCDEAVSALDVSIQSQIINLLQDLKEQFKLTYLFITHDLSVVKYISDRIGVMYLGNIVELADSDTIFSDAKHPYTRALLQAIPRTDVGAQELQILEGDVPSAVHPPEGCRFNTRCKYAHERCFNYEPALQEVSPGHFVACHLMDDPEFKFDDVI